MVGGVEALPFGLLTFVAGVLLVANLWAVVDAKVAVDAAARQATRHYVEADVSGPGGSARAEREAVAAGLAALDAHGRDPSRATVASSDWRSAMSFSSWTICTDEGSATRLPNRFSCPMWVPSARRCRA